MIGLAASVRNSRRSLTLGLVPLAFLAISLVGTGGAQANSNDADCKIFEIKATKEKGGVDPALKPLEKKLKKPPFDSWTSFKLLAQHSKKVVRMKALELKLAPGGKLTLLYRGPVQSEGKKTRLRLSFTLDGKSGKRVGDWTVQLDSGDFSVLGGESLGGGATYILATSCSVK